jgi:hypothetical protein
MRKKLGPGKCVHCLKDVEERNSDHVFPASWYPDSTPPNLEKWQIPSCIPCNSDYGKLESDLLSRVGLCLDPHATASKSIVESALRSMKYQAGRNDRDRALRAARGRKILGETLHGADIPETAVIPGMGNRWNLPTEEQVAVLLPAESLRRMTEKIVRGIFYIEEQKFIEPPYVIDFFVLPEDATAPWSQALDKFGTVYAREPGIVVRRTVAHEDNISSLFEITFWQHFKTYASLSRLEESEQPAVILDA